MEQRHLFGHREVVVVVVFLESELSEGGWSPLAVLSIDRVFECFDLTQTEDRFVAMVIASTILCIHCVVARHRDPQGTLKRRKDHIF